MIQLSSLDRLGEKSAQHADHCRDNDDGDDEIVGYVHSV